MLVLDAQQTRLALAWDDLVAALRAGFITDCTAPQRHHHEFEIPQEASGTLLLMPAWIAGQYLGVKQVLIIPENHRRNLSAVSASYQLYSALNGELLAVIDGGELTTRRTAAASALASTLLSRTDAKHLLMVGTGGLSRRLIPAHAAVRPIENVSVWGRNADKSAQLVQEMQSLGIAAETVNDLQQAAGQADIISCATMSQAPLIYGDWLRPGTHVDLVGSFTPDMRESDDALMQIADIFVDTRVGAMAEAGDILQPLADGLIAESDIRADLFDLCRSKHLGRQSDQQITVFKSVGTALEDLAAAVLCYQQHQEN